MRVLRTSSLSVGIRPSFFIIAFLFAIFMGTFLGYSLLIIGILFSVFFFHECGHIIVALLLGRPCETVIGGAGGRTEVLGPRLRFWQRTAVLVGGLLATYFVLVVTRLWLFDAEALSAPVREGLYLFFSLNAVWFWLNLLPLYPLDGGELLLDIGRSLFGRVGEWMVAIVSIMVSTLLAIYMLACWALFGVALCAYCIMKSCMILRHPVASHPGEMSEDAFHLHDLRQRWLAGEQDEVIAQMERLARDSDEQDVRVEAVECCSGYLLATERFREAYDFLRSAKDALTPTALENAQLASYRTSHWLEGLVAGRQAFRETQSLTVATMCAMLAGRLEMADEAISWLRMARMLGLDSLAKIIASSDFDPIRERLPHL